MGVKPGLEQLHFTRYFHNNKYFMYRCKCGVEKEIRSDAVNAGKVVSCGCWRSRKKGSVKDHELYNTWRLILRRCYNKRCSEYPKYGGRGICVWPDWQGKTGFEAFVKDVGKRPKGMTIDRIGVDGDYVPWNVQWATAKQQRNNQRRAVRK